MENTFKIILIDDDFGINEVLKIILEENNYIVSIVGNEENIIDKVNEIKPDLIILDLWMPNVDGTEICKNLKNNFETNIIPIIMLSASTQTEKLAIEAGADGFLPKPFEVEELLKTIEEKLKPKIPINQSTH